MTDFVKYFWNIAKYKTRKHIIFKRLAYMYSYYEKYQLTEKLF